MPMMKRVVLILAVLAASGACGSKGNGTADQPANQARSGARLRFAVIPKSLDLPVFNYAKVGAEREAKALGNVDVIWRGPENADQLKQKEILESFITQRVDGIAISCLNGDFLTETINRAVDAGIPVVTWDSDAPKSKRVAFYGVDDLAAGRIMGEQAVTLLGGKGKVAIITSVGATNLERRLAGVREVLAKHKGIRGRLARVHQERPGRGAADDEGDLVRHHSAGSRSAEGGKGAGAPRPEVLRLGRRVRTNPFRHQERPAACVADRGLGRRRRDGGERGRLREAGEGMGKR
jgi:ABC-type sugar transport system substrate-binding protein